MSSSRRSAFRVYLAGALFSLGGATCGGRAWRPFAGRSNVLIVTIDTLRVDRVGALGSALGATPNLDRLATRGTTFRAAFTTAPLTLPAHASLFSGRLPFRHGARINGTGRVAPSVPLLAEEFRGAGYETGAFIGSLVLRAATGLDRGFDTYDERFAANEGHPRDAWKAERRGDEVAGRAIAWLDRKRDRPFFLWVHLYDAHAPYDPPEPFRARFRSPYDGEVAAADAALGRVLDHLAADGRLARTIVAVAGDHGESLGEHGEETHGVFLYEATLRVPIVLARAGQERPETRSAPVSLVDIAPTLREAASLPSDAESDGISLLRLGGAVAEARVVFAEAVYPAALFGWSPLRAARGASLKYVEAPRRELYDVGKDPAEGENLFAPDDAPARDLARRLAKAFAASRPAAGPAGGADEEAMRRLASLGYMTPSGASSDLDRVDGSRVDPKDRIGAWPAIEKAIIARQLNRSAEAASLLASLDPGIRNGDPALLREFALVLRRSRRVREAVSTYEEILRRHPPVADDWFGLGIARHLLGQDDTAVAAHREAVRLRPDWPDAWINLGQELLALGRLAEAREAFARVVALDDRSVDGHSGLAAVAVEREDLATASAELRRALDADPGRAETLDNLARVERARGNQKEAERLLRQRDATRTPKPAAGPGAGPQEKELDG